MNIQDRQIILEDQTLRDGIQRESILIPTERKIEFLREMIGCGVKRFQVTAFVNPKKVPQMADAEKLIAEVQNFPDVLSLALILNLKGLERALRSGCRCVEISVSASHTHGIKNVGMGLSEAIYELNAMLSMARRERVHVKMSVQCAFGCQYEGAVSEAVVLDLIKRGLDMEVHEISLADTTGMGYPELILERVSRVKEIVGSVPLFLHLHDTDGKGMANVTAGIEAGVRHFDVTLGGTGGCPFIPFAPPNVAIETVVNAVHEKGFVTGIDGDRLKSVKQKLFSFLQLRPTH